MNNNQKANQIAIKQFRKELSNMLGDLKEIDKHVLTTAVNQGLAYIKRNTPVDTGFMRKSWRSPRISNIPGGIQKELLNSADYSSFVNFGHRVVNKSGETIGFIKGKYMLEKANHIVNKTMESKFKEMVEGVNKKYDK